jgi:hypothetical protein
MPITITPESLYEAFTQANSKFDRYQVERILTKVNDLFEAAVRSFQGQSGAGKPKDYIDYVADHSVRAADLQEVVRILRSKGFDAKVCKTDDYDNDNQNHPLFGYDCIRVSVKPLGPVKR